MNLLKKLFRAGDGSCVDVNGTCQARSRAFLGGKRRRSVYGSLSVVLLIAMLAAGCSSRTNTGEPSSSEPASVDENSSEVSSEEASSSSQPNVELLASATKFEPLQADKLRSALADRAKSYNENPVFTPPPSGDIAAWKKINNDVIGWITISNTNVNYPVVRTPAGQNNKYYEHLDIYKQSNKNGVVWTDMETQFNAAGDFTSTNTIIYGHNWTNYQRPIKIGRPSDVMLAQVAAYDDAAFAKQNPYIQVSTPSGDHTYQVFTAFYTKLNFKYYYAELPNKYVPMTMDEMVKKAISMSEHEFNVPMNKGDKFITLSICTRVLGPGDDQRFVVMAKKIS